MWRAKMPPTTHSSALLVITFWYVSDAIRKSRRVARALKRPRPREAGMRPGNLEHLECSLQPSPPGCFTKKLSEARGNGIGVFAAKGKESDT